MAYEQREQHPEDLVITAQHGDQQAFARLLLLYDYRTILQQILLKFLSLKTSQESREAIIRQSIRDLFAALPEFSADTETFDAWLRKTAEAHLLTERILINRAKKGERDAFLDLLARYRHILSEVVQHYAAALQKNNEGVLEGELIEDAFRAVRTLRPQYDAFGRWLRQVTTESCVFLQIQEESLQGKHNEAFETLSACYTPFIQQILLHDFPNLNAQDREEVELDVKLYMYRTLPTFRAKAYSFRCLLRKAVKGLCLNKLRQHRRRLEQQATIEFDIIPDPAHNQEIVYRTKEETEFIREVILLLPTIYQDVLELREQQDLQYEEIAEVLHLPLGTVQRRLHEARKQLDKIRRIVEECGKPLQVIVSKVRQQGIRLTKVIQEFSTECFGHGNNDNEA